MKKPEVPEDEPARLETLHSLGILDTPPEERFDRLTRMAKRLFGVPIALVSLVDENRQWFKSCVGLSVTQLPREVSFCGHAILGSGIFVIPDAAEDPRFADNPLVVDDPHIRFYAGCPIRAPDGQALGTLCIIDRLPRALATEDLAVLADLAAMVEREFSALQLATMDELTCISNRRGFMMLAQQSMNFSKREKVPSTLVYMDINKLKPINDTFGHAEGDRVLADFAVQLKNTFREADIVARLGGDEFAVLLTNCTREATDDSIGRLRASVERLTRGGDRDYGISFAYGVVEFDPDNHPTVQALLADGDSLMYQAKRTGSNAAG